MKLCLARGLTGIESLKVKLAWAELVKWTHVEPKHAQLFAVAE